MAGVRQLYGKYKAGETMPQINQFCTLEQTVALMQASQERGRTTAACGFAFVGGGRYFGRGGSMLTERANEVSQEKRK